MTMTSIGIIGAGNIGEAFARALVRNGIAATISNSRGPDSLADLVREIGPTITAGTRDEAASKDIVLVAVNWSKLPAALKGLPDFSGRIVIDANNPIEGPLFKPAELHGRLSSEVFTGLVPGARVVKAFNHLQPHLLSGDPAAEGGRRVLFYSGTTPGPRLRSALSSSVSGSLGSISVRSASAGASFSFLADHCPHITSSASAENSTRSHVSTPDDVVAGLSSQRRLTGT
jgi:predicted dinucleotide-binding enzyme